MAHIKIRILEIRDSFKPKKVLEYRPVFYFGEGVHYDPVTRQFGFSTTGRTFRSSYASLMELCPKPKESDGRENL